MSQGQHKSPRRLISQKDPSWKLQDKAAENSGVSWAVWARGILHCAALEQLKLGECADPWEDPAELEKILKKKKL